VTRVLFLRSALGLFKRSERIKLLVAAFIQTFSSILDLTIVAGLVIVIALVNGGGIPASLGDNIGFLLPSNVQSVDVVRNFSLAFIALIFSRILLAIFMIKHIYFFLSKVAARISVEALDSLCDLDLPQIHKRGTAEYMWLLTGGIQTLVVTGIASFLMIIAESFLLILLGFALVLTSPWIGVFFIGFFSLFVLIINKYFSPATQRAMSKKVDISNISNKFILERLDTYREILTRNISHAFALEFVNNRRTDAKINADVNYLSTLPKYLIEAFFYLGFAFLVFFLSYSNDSGKTFYVLGIFLAIGTRLIPSIVRLQFAFQSLNS
jgi:hypothetical protein